MQTTTQETQQAQPEEAKAAQRPALTVGGGVSAIVPRDIEQAFRLASAICAANMAPKSYNRDANAIMVGILHGMEVGYTPMAALQSIAVINGMPSIWGDGAMALVDASGKLEDIKEWIEGEGESMAAHCEAKRLGRTSPIIRTFSVGDAKKANLWNKKGPWQDYPQRMLQMRARSWVLRDGFADVLRGLNIREEVEDMVNVTPPKNDAPARPQQADYIPTPSPAVEPEPEEQETYRLLDAYGEGESFLPRSDFVAAIQEEIPALVEGGIPQALRAFWEHNEEAVASLGEGRDDTDRQAISKAYNDACAVLPLEEKADA